MTTWNDGGATTVVNTYTYNKRRLPTAETQTNDFYLWTLGYGYGYDGIGNLAAVSYPANLVVTYSPNALGFF